MVFFAFNFLGILFCLNQSSLIFVDLLVVLGHDIILHANTYPKLLKHISQIAAVLLEIEAGLSIIVCAR